MRDSLGHSLTPDARPLRIASRDLVARDHVAHFNPHTDYSGSPIGPEGTLMKTRTPIRAADLCGIFTAVAFLLDARSLIFPRFILDESLGIHVDRARGPFLQAVA